METILGQQFLVPTNHRSLRHLLQQQVTTPTQQHWVAKLLGCDLQFQYKTRVSNKVANALSHQDEDMECYTISKTLWLKLDEIDMEIQQDPHWRKVFVELQ